MGVCVESNSLNECMPFGLNHAEEHRTDWNTLAKYAGNSVARAALVALKISPFRHVPASEGTRRPLISKGWHLSTQYPISICEDDAVHRGTGGGGGGLRASASPKAKSSAVQHDLALSPTTMHDKQRSIRTKSILNHRAVEFRL